MPSSDDKNSPAILVARFLALNGYEKTLAAFLSESALPTSAGEISSSSALTLESLLDAHKRYGTSQSFTKTSASVEQAWTQPSPSRAQELPLPDIARHNVLHVMAAPILLPDDQISEAGNQRRRIVVTTATKAVCVFEFVSTPDRKIPKPSLLARWMPQDAPVLSWTVLTRDWSVGTAMSGQVVLFSTSRAKVVAQRRDHQKYVVRAAAIDAEDEQTEMEGLKTFYVATAGWDARVHLYRLCLPAGSSEGTEDPDFSGPVASLDLPSNPEDIQFHRTIGKIVLIVTRRDSASLHFFTVPSLEPLGKQSLAPHSGPWTPFSLTSLSPSPLDSSLLAVATSGTDFTKLIVVRLLLPATSQHRPHGPSTEIIEADTQHRARKAAAEEDAAAAAIYLAVPTRAPSSAYSTPKAVWRADGSGLWINGDDGAVRGISMNSGQEAVVLGPAAEGGADGHEVEAKVRDIWAGWASAPSDRNGEEWVITGGFDRRALLWTVPDV